MRPLIWFRTDLRVTDNFALHHACAAGKGVVALFVISPGEWRQHDWAGVKVEFVLRTLGELSRNLAKLNIPLLIAHAPTLKDVPGAVLDAAVANNCDAVFFNREYEVNEAARDERTIELFKGQGLGAFAYHDQVLCPPGELRSGAGGFYTVFTPFKKASYARMLERGTPEMVPAPKKLAAMVCAPSPVPTRVDGFDSHVSSERWPAGEHAAMARLGAFVDARVASYKAQRDLPAIDGTSQLSHHLNVGAISVRQCLHAALNANTSHAKDKPFDSGSDGIVHWISELLWREFYIHIMVGFPRVCKHRAFQPATEAIEWNDNEAHFQAWCEGRTGVPIVDAGMRQLLRDGWMHNRVRMITAMYLTKNLFIDWRRGETFFMRHLVDGFLASNNGGWQWSASTGTDAAPYFRVFNPVSQSQKCDPSGAYIRAFVPELRSLETDAIHEPWELVPMARQRIDYPEPIVDLSKSRARAIEAFRALKQAQ